MTLNVQANELLGSYHLDYALFRRVVTIKTRIGFCYHELISCDVIKIFVHLQRQVNIFIPPG